MFKKIGQLVNKQAKIKKLTKFKKMLTEVIHTYQIEKTNLNSQLQSSQVEIKQFKQSKQGLEDKLSRRKETKKTDFMPKSKH